MTTLLDRRAVRAGAGLTLLIAVPAAVVVRLIKGGDLAGGESNWWVAAAVAVLLAFAAGGWLAARRSHDMPLSHSAVAAAWAFVLMVVASLLVALTGGGQVRASFVLLVGLLAALCVSLAVIGGYAASRRGGLR